MITFPAKPKTMMELYQMLPEGTSVQLIENALHMSPAPNTLHARTARKIFLAIEYFVTNNNLGEVFFAPVDVYLDDKNVFQPDVFFLAAEEIDFVKKDGIYGAPSIAVEVLSPFNKKDDLLKKKPVYERCGVKEYFIIDPEDGSVLSYYHNGAVFEEAKTTNIIDSKILTQKFLF
jgi:Uma2 family endonuclease